MRNRVLQCVVINEFLTNIIRNHVLDNKSSFDGSQDTIIVLIRVINFITRLPSGLFRCPASSERDKNSEQATTSLLILPIPLGPFNKLHDFNMKFTKSIAKFWIKILSEFRKASNHIDIMKLDA